MWRIVAMAVFVCSLCSGCAFIKPTTEVSGPGGWHFVDTKDNDVTIKGAKYNSATHDGGIDEVVVSNKASPVIEANVQQMLAFVEQQKAANEGIKIAFAGLSDMISQLTPLVGMLRTQTSSLTELQTAIGTLTKKIESIPAIPATQPSAPSNPVNN
jgi:hypothetical protein